MRKIIHVDMDAFYASVEQRDRPQLKGKPVIISHSPEQRGVVCTCSYEARKFGVRSAMSAFKAKQLCPHGFFIEPRMSYYKQISRQIRDIFARYTDKIEPLAFDEAYLDVSHHRSATVVAKQIQADIWHELQLTASAGVSYNKFLAKLASGYKKPAGLTVVTPDEALAFLAPLPIGEFFGVGKVTEEKMIQHGILTGADLIACTEDELIRLFQKRGRDFYRYARGIDDSPVDYDRERKSIGREETFHQNQWNEARILAKLTELCHDVERALIAHEKHGKTITVKVKYSDFTAHTKQVSLSYYCHTASDLLQYGTKLWREVDDGKLPIRNIGIYVSNLAPLTYQNLSIYDFL